MDSCAKVSLIIPVYNVEKYIDECLKSILKQHCQDFEVILIDDGSTDSSGHICDFYVETDPRFHVIHTDNNGIGAARNLAMNHMKGEFCFFLDPDDVLEDDSLSYLIELIEKTQSDMALAVTRQFRGDYVTANNPKPTETVYDGRIGIIENVLFDKNDLKPLSRKSESSKVTYEFFSTLYRTDNLKKNDIHFLPISYGEDTYVCFKSLLTSERVVTSSKIVYSHRRNPTSTTFQYHSFYLDETKEYYRFYLGLFEDFAPAYLPRAKEGLDAQYLRRCLSAIERELLMSPPHRTVKEKVETIRQINADEKFREMFTFANMKYTSPGLIRWSLISIKLGMYPWTVAIISKVRRI